MTRASQGLVDILREFLATYVAVRRLLDRYTRGELEFREVDAVFVDSEESSLFRLKEHCHARFRPMADAAAGVGHPELLFDLAVGSLFHETMKFRENFYQHDVYGPRVRALRDAAGQHATELFREFEKIEEAVSARLDEGLQETEVLLAQTRAQLVVLLAAHPENGRVARRLIEEADRVEEIFPEGLDALLASIYGDAVAGYERAAASYITSGYYAEARGALAGALERGGDAAALAPHTAYATGMAAYLAGNYGESIAHLDAWLSGGAPGEPARADLVHAALAKIDQLVQSEDRDQVVADAHSLLARLTALREPAAAS